MEFEAFLMPWAGCPEEEFGVHCIAAEYLGSYPPEYIDDILKKCTLPQDWSIIDFAYYLFDSYADGTKWYLYKETRMKMYKCMYEDTTRIMIYGA